VLGLSPLANLPYIIDGEAAIAQSTSCMVYVGEKFSLYGGIRDLELLTEIYDLRNALIDLVYPFKKVCRDQGEYEKAAEAQIQKVAPRFYAKLEQVLDKAGTLYTIKETPCCADFHIWEMLDQHEALAAKHEHPSPLTKFPKLAKMYVAFKQEPKLANYFASDAYKLPINNPMANTYFH